MALSRPTLIDPQPLAPMASYLQSLAGSCVSDVVDDSGDYVYEVCFESTVKQDGTLLGISPRKYAPEDQFGITRVWGYTSDVIS